MKLAEMQRIRATNSGKIAGILKIIDNQLPTLKRSQIRNLVRQALAYDAEIDAIYEEFIKTPSEEI